MRLPAITIRQPFAQQIITGTKTVEFRSWPTKIRGPLLIHASSNTSLCSSDDSFHFGALIGVVDVIDCRLQRKEFCWLLANPRQFEPVEWKGTLKIQYIDIDELAAEFPDLTFLLSLNSLPRPSDATTVA